MTAAGERRWPITSDLALLRGHVHSHAAQAGLSGERLDDLLIAANEAAINVLEHGGGQGTVSVWREEGFLAVEVADSAGRLRPEDAARVRPSADASRGFGLWLMSQLCDQLSIDQDRRGSRVLLRMRLVRPSPSG
ncbi:ATP-binding protein [Planomonospora sp. ID67723]|uniref:ATP-binding protein n=1 Tax=Planomonospora sp. ID67723 TaxID=2738134 RepID=UPI0018C3EEF1|nr:ATP-binding protein [Planomonospora sp. ID67723]MBG0832022.1 ATP-binding protein [Planomonospora sp. ID67723]